MMASAYGRRMSRLIFAVPIPDTRYDYISNLPERQAEALQQQIKKQFGLTARSEMIEKDVLILRVKSPGTGPKRSAGQISGLQTRDSYSAHCQSLWGLNDYLELYLGAFVIDRTGLTGNFDIEFKWDSTPEGLKRALEEHAGLELVPSHEALEFLTIEKAK
jgi:uncharacterized protein (TIGR03435 family)